jgi:Protein of unknown function (DUF760)
MDNSLDRISEFFDGDAEATNELWQYVQSMNPDTIGKLSRPESGEVMQVMERNVLGLLGSLPSEHFDLTITTSRGNLGRLLISAMMSGYFLRNAEQRLLFENSLSED